MYSEVTNLSDRLKRAEENRKAFRRFFCRDEREMEDQWEQGDLECAGDLLAIRLRDNPREVRAMKRAMSAQLETAGAYLIPQTFADYFEEALLYASALRDWATVIPTERGGAWKLPMVDDTANEGVIVPENSLPSPDGLDITTFQSLTLYTQKFSSNWFTIPHELIEDVPDLIERKLAGVLARRIGRLQNITFTPQILASATLGGITASATVIASDDLTNLYFSIDPAYRESPGFCWQMANSTLQYIREIKDGQGRYIFQQRTKEDEYDLILGKPAIVNRDMAAIASANITVACGDFSKVTIRDVGREVQLKVTNERFADPDQTGVIGFMRSEAALTDAGTHPIKYLQQHS